jgi:hypothetical protein
MPFWFVKQVNRVLRNYASVFTSVCCLIPVLCTGRKSIFIVANEAFTRWLAGMSFPVPAGGTELKQFLLSMADHNFCLSSISSHFIHFYAYIILMDICILHHECCRRNEFQFVFSYSCSVKTTPCADLLLQPTNVFWDATRREYNRGNFTGTGHLFLSLFSIWYILGIGSRTHDVIDICHVFRQSLDERVEQ